MCCADAAVEKKIGAWAAWPPPRRRLYFVTFRYKSDPQGTVQYGLVAEEVAAIYPELVGRRPNGEPESVQYHELIPMLLNELQRQQKELDRQRARNADLEARSTALEQGTARRVALAGL